MKSGVPNTANDTLGHISSGEPIMVPAEDEALLFAVPDNYIPGFQGLLIAAKVVKNKDGSLKKAVWPGKIEGVQPEVLVNLDIKGPGFIARALRRSKQQPGFRISVVQR